MTAIAVNVRTIRSMLGLSQEELAHRLRVHPRAVLRWENGQAKPSARSLRAMARYLGPMGIAPVVEDAAGGRHVLVLAPFAQPDEDDATLSDGGMEGIWLSQYVYHSTARDALFMSQHNMLVRIDGGHLLAESLPFHTAPSMALNLDVDGEILTGRWDEHCDPRGHYLGDHRWGAVQFIVTPSRQRLDGQWVGWGSGRRINTGHWLLRRVTADTSEASLALYSHALPDEPVILVGQSIHEEEYTS